MKNVLVIAAFIFNATQLSAGPVVSTTGNLISATSRVVGAGGDIVNAIGVPPPVGNIIKASAGAGEAVGGLVSATAPAVNMIVHIILVTLRIREQDQVPNPDQNDTESATK
jgi:hypothetical protein